MLVQQQEWIRQPLPDEEKAALAALCSALAGPTTSSSPEQMLQLLQLCPPVINLRQRNTLPVVVLVSGLFSNTLQLFLSSQHAVTAEQLAAAACAAVGMRHYDAGLCSRALAALAACLANGVRGGISHGNQASQTFADVLYACAWVGYPAADLEEALVAVLCAGDHHLEFVVGSCNLYDAVSVLWSLTVLDLLGHQGRWCRPLVSGLLRRLQAAVSGNPGNLLSDEISRLDDPRKKLLNQLTLVDFEIRRLGLDLPPVPPLLAQEGREAHMTDDGSHICENVFKMLKEQVGKPGSCVISVQKEVPFAEGCRRADILVSLLAPSAAASAWGRDKEVRVTMEVEVVGGGEEGRVAVKLGVDEGGDGGGVMEKVAVEVDGPLHFMRNAMERLNGPTQFRNRWLEAEFPRVVYVSALDFKAVGSIDMQKAYLADKIGFAFT